MGAVASGSNWMQSTLALSAANSSEVRTSAAASALCSSRTAWRLTSATASSVRGKDWVSYLLLRLWPKQGCNIPIYFYAHLPAFLRTSDTRLSSSPAGLLKDIVIEACPYGSEYGSLCRFFSEAISPLHRGASPRAVRVAVGINVWPRWRAQTARFVFSTMPTMQFNIWSIDAVVTSCYLKVS